MTVMGIDLSLRSTGVCIIGATTYPIFRLVPTSKDKFTDEGTIIYIWEQIKSYIDEWKPTHIAIEDLSYDSISSSKDFIAGNFWYLRANIHKNYPDITVSIITVAEWRNPLFDKEERKKLTADKKELKALKVILKTATKAEKSAMVLENEQLILNCDIKHLTYLKLPDTVTALIEHHVVNKSRFDLCDAYFLTKFYQSRLSEATV